MGNTKRHKQANCQLATCKAESATRNGHKVDRWWGRCYLLLLLLLLLRASRRQVVCWCRWCWVARRCPLDVAARLVFGVQYEPQLRHLIEHLLTRLGMLTYYWPCSQLMQQLPPSPVAPLQQLLSHSLTHSLSPSFSGPVRLWNVARPHRACVSGATASVSEVCSYLTVKAFIIIRLNLKTFWSGLSC